ncbi:MAG: hypothetical protein LBH56_04625 [Coriobacteriales bacterium]|nr:hypothetical protein [Coriobacteriales bacterium]
MNKTPAIIAAIIVIIVLCCCSLCAMLWTAHSWQQAKEMYTNNGNASDERIGQEPRS